MLKHHLEKLEHFVGSVKAGSIRSYSVSNNLSQPSVSKCIQNLETDLEVSLLVRNRSGIQVTQAGRRLFEYGDRILAEADRLGTALRSQSRLRISGKLIMGTYQSIAVYFVPSFFKFIQKEQQDLTMNLMSAPSDELVQALRTGKVDLIVSIDPPLLPEFYQITILHDTYSLYKPLKFQLPPEKSFIFTLPQAKDSRGKSVVKYLSDAKLGMRMSSCGDFESVKAMIEQGIGYGFLPDRVAKPLLDSGKIELAVSPKNLLHVGEHALVFSCRKHRATDVTITWIRDQLALMLSEKNQN